MYGNGGTDVIPLGNYNTIGRYFQSGTTSAGAYDNNMFGNGFMVRNANNPVALAYEFDNPQIVNNYKYGLIIQDKRRMLGNYEHQK